ncbi:MAG: SDR family oxidoreductase [Pseudomonadota bacterium]
MDLGLSGKKVIISAATRGVGLVAARTFLEEGAEVAICGRRPGKGEAFAPGYQGEGHPLAQKGVADAVELLSGFGTAHGSVVDCADEAAVRSWVSEAAEAMGGIDVVVSNASALGGRPNDREAWDLSYNVDLMSSVALFDAALPWLRKAVKRSGSAAFVQTGSVAAIEDHPFGENLSYAAMKAALINTVHQLAHRHMHKGIRCNTVCPGPTFIEDGSWGFLEDYMPDYHAENKGRHPAGRFGRPEEIANAIVFMASERASWIMGENLVVDGGYTTHVKF